MVCGHYRMTPAAVGSLTPAELLVMLDGADWESDRAWERSMLPLVSKPQNFLDLRYPHFRVDPVVKIIEPDPEEDPKPAPVPTLGKVALGG